MNRKVISCGLSAIVLLTVLAMGMPASAQVQMADEFGVEDAMGNPGDYVNVLVNITNVKNGPIVAIEFELIYRKAVLELTGVQKGELTADWGDPEQKGEYGIGLVGAPSKAIQNGANGSVVNLTFHVIGAENSGMDLSNIIFYNTPAYQEGTALAKNGTFYVTGEVADDININEIMYNPPTPEDQYEWIELYNNDTQPIDLSGWVLNGTIGGSDTILSGTMAKGEYLVIAKNVSAFHERYPSATCPAIKGNWSSLANSGDWINLSNATGVSIDSVNYPGGFSDNYSAELNATGWYESKIEGGTPCQPNSVLAPLVDTTAPTTNVTAPPEITTPISSGTELPWTNEDVNISFRRTDNDGGNPSGINYTNLSAQTTITDVNVNGTTMTIPQIGTGNLTINTTTFGETFNVTISDELITKIYYYSVDKNDTPNVEDTKNLTVRIDKTLPYIISVELNKTSVNASESINVSVNVTDPQNGEVASGIANVTADGVELTKQNGNWWNGTITAATTQGLHNVTVIAYDNAGNTETNDTVQYEVTAAGAPNITSYAPGTPVYDSEGAPRTFNITVDQVVNVSWQINGTEVEFNESVTEANYTNTSAVIGTWNVSAIATNTTTGLSNMQTWDWIVTAMPYGVELTVKPPQLIPVPPSENATFTLIVKNTGTVNDTFNLTTVGVPANVNATLSANVTSELVPDGTHEVSLNVSSAIIGEYIVNVMATSQGDSNVNATASTTTNVTLIPHRAVTLVYNDNNIGYNYEAWTGNYTINASGLVSMIRDGVGTEVFPDGAFIAYPNKTSGAWEIFFGNGTGTNFVLQQYNVTCVRVASPGGTFYMPK